MTFDKAFFDAGVNRVGTDCEKWDGMFETHGTNDLIPMWVADMDFPSAPAIYEALNGVLSWRTWGYTMSGRQDAEALAGYWQRRHGVSIDPDHVIISPCVVTGMKLAVRAATNPGDGVLITTPVYGPFYMSIKDNDRKTVEVPLVVGEDGRYNINLPEMEARLKDGSAKAVMLCSPHNPCGRAWRKEEMQAVADLCMKYGIPLIVDEIHADFVFAPNCHHSVLSLDRLPEKTVMLCAASKTYNVAGLEQSAIVCANDDLRAAIAKDMNAAGVKGGNCFALAATRAAYTSCDEWLDGLKEYLIANRDFVYEYVKANMPKIKVTPLDATYLMCLDCRALSLEQQEMMDRIIAAGVKVNDGLFFGELGRGHVRLNIGCPRAQLEAALEKLGTVLGK